MRCLRLVPLVALLLCTACGGGSLDPSADGPLRLTTVVDHPNVAPGEHITITHRLENSGSQTVVLHFSDGCQIDSFVRNLGTGEVQQLAGAVCTLALTELELSGGASKTWEDVVALSRGRYGAYATVTDMNAAFTLRSGTATFEVN